MVQEFMAMKNMTDTCKASCPIEETTLKSTRKSKSKIISDDELQSLEASANITTES